MLFDCCELHVYTDNKNLTYHFLFVLHSLSLLFFHILSNCLLDFCIVCGVVLHSSSLDNLCNLLMVHCIASLIDAVGHGETLHGSHSSFLPHVELDLGDVLKFGLNVLLMVSRGGGQRHIHLVRILFAELVGLADQLIRAALCLLAN